MYQNDVERLVRLFIWSIVTMAIGIGLTKGTLNGGPMPLNKNLWTLSFSFFMGTNLVLETNQIYYDIRLFFSYSRFGICWTFNHVYSH